MAYSDSDKRRHAARPDAAPLRCNGGLTKARNRITTAMDALHAYTVASPRTLEDGRRVLRAIREARQHLDDALIAAARLP